MTSDPLGPEWGYGPDGLRTRDASRVVVLDDAGRVLLVRGGDPTRPGEQWWFTVGGGREAGEDGRRAARRELREEAGIDAAEDAFEGPVWRRVADFPFFGQPCRQSEEFYVLRLDSTVTLSRDGWTAMESDVLTDLRWWDPADLAASGDTYYPTTLPALLAELPARFTGEPRTIGD
ncbi:NUDIX hydrolase [Kineococcus gynurae]|uniref:NUDIX hydrolase n=1 Tax=Kineococcus gynurae TaxID=452979 RepID=UPI0035EF9C98